jgi:hypothetical protein
MGKVTRTLSKLTNQTIGDEGLERYVVPAYGRSTPFPIWNTKTPVSTVGKVGENGLNGKYARVVDAHRGTVMVEGMAAAVFAEKLAEGLRKQGAGVISAAVQTFDSPRTDAELRERSRKIIVDFWHTDGEEYTGEIQIHSPEGIARYVGTREQYDAQRAEVRARGIEWVAGHVALLGSSIVIV